ncbi:carbohydrate ABC transporter permease [Virgibacillus halophilus]|uniref:Sugar ABC transporter permease n=1 Tax=Tigheibacillus halophilus TaxID=361280 RepID=A0ABU5C2W7_9BACI|nr:sugar ABC transporter permease [Virgibacillus halophilus]
MESADLQKKKKSNLNVFRGNSRNQTIVRFLFVVPTIIYILMFFGFPLAYNIIISFKDFTAESMLNGNSEFVGFKNYINVFKDTLMIKATFNTIIFTITSIALQFILGMMLALFFNKTFPLSQTLRSMLLLPWLLPLVVSATSWKWMMEHAYGIINHVLLNTNIISEPIGWTIDPNLSLYSVIIVNIWVGIPFNLVLLYTGLQSIPVSIYEAAKIDGAGKWETFRYITLPMLRPVISIILMLGFIYTIKQFDLFQALTGGGPGNSSQVYSTWLYQLSFGELKFGLGAAVGNVMLFLALIFAFAYIWAIRKEE